jgi:hypothetical protein
MEALLPQPDTPIMSASNNSTRAIAAQRLENRLQLDSRGTLLLSGRGDNETSFIAVPPSKFVLWGPGGMWFWSGHQNRNGDLQHNSIGGKLSLERERC